MSNVHWEVLTIFNWGTTCKTTYRTRELARAGLKGTKVTFTTNGKQASYVSFKLFKVRRLPGLSKLAGNKSGVYIYEEKS